ncbi:hypothetical protein DVH05_024366 [Phytophthora capsici]|nr:hypothetical protein DVH05_024366 [Phytophthora capsici]
MDSESPKENFAVLSQESGDVDTEPSATPRMTNTQERIAFAPPPKRKGLSRRAEKLKAGAEEMRGAKKLRVDSAEERKTRSVKLADMSILSGPYSRYTAKPLVDNLLLKFTEHLISGGSMLVKPYQLSELFRS